jgi:hypothetical protein
MLHVSQLRGAQSGGGAIKVRDGQHPRQIIAKCVNGKRSDLASRLTRLMARSGARKAVGSSYVLQTHVRFATSGPATLDESHPFRFVCFEQHGARRVFLVNARESAPTLRPIETAITHNGDLNALHFRGVRLAHPDLGWFFERVLEAPNRWAGDSPSLAGAFELFLTQGMWLESLRLAHLEIVSPPPPDVSGLAGAQAGPRRAAFVRELLAQYHAPARALLAELAQTAERVWLATDPACRGRGVERVSLALRLAAGFRQSGASGVPEGAHELLARRAVDLFLDHDLYRAARNVEACVEGTFGCVITSTLEPDTVVAFSRGQPLSLGIQAETGTVAIASERNALRIRDDAGRAVFDARLDFDLNRAEIARISLGESFQPQLLLHSVAAGHTYSRGELEVSGRLVSLCDNPLTQPLPVERPWRVRADLLDIPDLLRGIRDDFQDVQSFNRRTAEALVRELLDAPRPRLLVIGITSDLWLAQQFVRNLQLCLPGVCAEARSSNEVLQDSTRALDATTLVLAISQSGQDFPTLAALCLLQQRLGAGGGGRLFVLTGEHDTLMGQAVGQSYAKRAPWIGRILANGGGYRPSEAATASVSATHATLCELLLLLCARALEQPQRGHGVTLEAPHLALLSARRDACVERHAAAIVSGAGADRVSDIARLLTSQSRRWTWHLLEGIVAFFAAAFVLELNLQAGVELRPSWLLRWLPVERAANAALTQVWEAFGTQIDVFFYLFLAPILIWLLRCVQRRPVLHRQGTRELLIGDTGYVRQVVWLLARRLFSLSYGFASIKPYAADNQDDLIMTHEPLRGTLALFGLPDARRAHLRGHAAAAAMTAQQFAGSRSLGGEGAEILTVGHTPHAPTRGPHLGLPSDPVVEGTRELDLLVEGMFDSWERMLSMQTLLTQVAEAVAAFYPLTYDPSRTKDRVFAPTTASPVSGASFLGLGSFAKGALRFSRVSIPFDILTRSRVSKPSAPHSIAGLLASEPAPLVTTSESAHEPEQGRVAVLPSIRVGGTDPAERGPEKRARLDSTTGATPRAGHDTPRIEGS